MATGKIEYGIRSVWSETALRALGPTVSEAFRGSAQLPHPGAATSTTDANTIYLDPIGGSDANSGFTLAAAKLTLAGALAVISVTRPNLHIQRASGEGVYSLTQHLSSATVNLDADLLVIQVHPGQICTINQTGGTYVQQNNLTINGVKWIHSSADILSSSNFNLTTEWAWMQSPRRVLSGSSGGANLDTTDSVFLRTESDIEDEVIAWAGDSIVMGHTVVMDAVNNSASLMVLGAATVGTVNLDLDFCNFIGAEKAISLTHSSGDLTGSATNCIFHNVGTAIEYDGSDATPQAIEISNSLVNVRTPGTAAVLGDDNVYDKNPLFADELGFDFKLWNVGLEAPQLSFYAIPRYYPQNSPAVGIAVGGLDAGASQFSYAISGNNSKTLTFPDGFAPEAVKLTRIRSGYQQFKTLSGFAFATWDFMRHQIEITMPGNYFVGGDFALDYADFLFASGLARFYPQGDDGVCGTATVVWNNDPDTPLILLTLSRDTRNNQFMGMVVQIDWELATVAKQTFVRIIWGEGSGYVTQFIRGDTPDVMDGGVGTAKVLYYPVILDGESTELVSEIYSEDEDTVVQKPWYKGEDDEHVSEWHTRTIRLVETLETGNE